MAENLSDLITRLGEAAMDAREATREVHAAVKDARMVLKELREAAATSVQERLQPIVNQAIAELGDATEEAINRSEKRIGNEFKRLERAYLGGGPGDPPLENLLRTAKDLRDFRTAKNKGLAE